MNCTDPGLVKVGLGADDEGGCLRMSWCCGYGVTVVEMTRSDPGPWSWLRMLLYMLVIMGLDLFFQCVIPPPSCFSECTDDVNNNVHLSRAHQRPERSHNTY